MRVLHPLFNYCSRCAYPPQHPRRNPTQRHGHPPALSHGLPARLCAGGPPVSASKLRAAAAGESSTHPIHPAPRTVDRPPLPARQVPVLLQPACAASQTLPAAAPLRTRLPSAGSAAVREPTGRRAARLSIALQAARSIRINRTWSPDEPHIEATAYELTVSRRPSSCCTSLNRPVDAQVQQRARGTSTS